MCPEPFRELLRAAEHGLERTCGKQAFPVDTPSTLIVFPWVTVAIQGQMTNLTWSVNWKRLPQVAKLIWECVGPMEGATIRVWPGTIHEYKKSLAKKMGVLL